MPTISFSLKDLEKLVGKKLSVNDVEELVEYGKGDFEGYDKETDEIKVDFGDTNLPYLWSVEGVSRLIKGILGKQKGIPGIKINKADYGLKVDNSVNKIRPYVAAFVAKGHKIDDYLLKQMIQLQEKLCENYGRRREKIAIGVYSYKKITFPVHYKATSPESVKFIPLEFRKEMTQQEILEEHPAGREYAWILKDFKKYPILVDDKNVVLSFPPIINSAVTGKIEPGEEDIFFEATGTDLKSLLLATNVFAYALSDRGFKIYSVDVKYPNKKITTPFLFNEKIKIKKEDIKKLMGLDLKDSEVKRLLERVQYNYSNGLVSIPPYRGDILHAHDVVEDIAISYDYNKIPEVALKSYTIGETSKLMDFCDKVREIIIGLGYQEMMSPILSNKEFLTKKMNFDLAVVEIENFVSETYSAVRAWLLPVLMEVLSKNKHVEYPQRVFEQGLVSVRKKEDIVDYERAALVSAHEKADYTEVKQALDYLLRMLGVEYEIIEAEHDSFISGRVGRVVVKGKKVAYIGEINPAVLSQWDINVPVAGFELNLSELFKVVS